LPIIVTFAKRPYALVDTYARLHARNVVHGDVHPRNILVDADDRISVLDFGLGRVLEPGSPHDHAQRAGFSWNTEPEAAASLAASGAAGAASTAGEQFRSRLSSTHSFAANITRARRPRAMTC
jgi:serine/threonine protein kinase